MAKSEKTKQEIERELEDRRRLELAHDLEARHPFLALLLRLRARDFLPTITALDKLHDDIAARVLRDGHTGTLSIKIRFDRLVAGELTVQDVWSADTKARIAKSEKGSTTFRRDAPGQLRLAFGDEAA